MTEEAGSGFVDALVRSARSRLTFGSTITRPHPNISTVGEMIESERREQRDTLAAAMGITPGMRRFFLNGGEVDLSEREEHVADAVEETGDGFVEAIRRGGPIRVLRDDLSEHVVDAVASQEVARNPHHNVMVNVNADLDAFVHNREEVARIAGAVNTSMQGRAGRIGRHEVMFQSGGTLPEGLSQDPDPDDVRSNSAIQVNGNYMYIMDNTDELRIVDVSDPVSPVVVSNTIVGRNPRSMSFVAGGPGTRLDDPVGWTVPFRLGRRVTLTEEECEDLRVAWLTLEEELENIVCQDNTQNAMRVLADLVDKVRKSEPYKEVDVDPLATPKRRLNVGV